MALRLAVALLLLVAVAADVALLPPLERMLTQATNCSGWPEPRQFIEAQQWWTNAGDDIDSQSQHFHLGGCMPYNQTLTGIVTIDVLFQIHNHPDHVLREVFLAAPARVNPEGGPSVDTTISKLGSTGPLDFSCPPEASRTCMRAFRIELDSSLVPSDCVAPLRLRADVRVRPGVPTNLAAGVGYGYLPELSFKVRYANGHPACALPSDPNYIPEATTIASGFNDFPWSYTRLSINHDVLPTRPVSGVWTIRQLRAFDQRTENRISPVLAPVTRSFVTVNPRFHALNATTGLPAPLLGRVVLDEPNLIYRNVQVDTAGLADGSTNVLFFRTDSFIAPGTTFPDEVPWLPGTTHMFSGRRPHPGGTSSAVLAFSFRVSHAPPQAA